MNMLFPVAAVDVSDDAETCLRKTDLLIHNHYQYGELAESYYISIRRVC